MLGTFRTNSPALKRALLLATVVFALPAATAAQSALSFAQSISPPTIGPDSAATVTFTITNNTGTPITDLAFADSLPAGVTVADAPGITVTDTCTGGALTGAAGDGSISFADGGVGGGATCEITVNVTSSTIGTVTNTTSALTSSAGTTAAASADLTVATDRPGFTKSFSPGSVFFGDRSTLTFTIDNSANPAAAINLAFTDDLPPGMIVASPASSSTTCGGTLTAVEGGSSISLAQFPTPSNVAANGTCTVSVDIVANSVGALENTSGDFTSTPFPAGTTRSSGFASATLDVALEQLRLTKEFLDDPTAPGGAVDLQFTVLNLDRSSAATNIAFTDDLDATLSGLQATGLPTDPCGAGSSITGSGLLSFSGGSLPAEGSCSFTVTLAVPSTATTGPYTNSTSTVTGIVGGSSTTGNPATDTLFVSAAPLLTKTFTDDPVGAGEDVTLEFSITNTSATASAEDITFTDDFPSEIQAAANVPADGFCGTGSTATFTPPSNFDPARLTVAGAELAAGDSCTFSVVLTLSVDAASTVLTNTTSPITATIDGLTEVGSPASDDLVIVGAPELEKSFVDDPAQSGGTVDLKFSLTSEEQAAGDYSGITFSDDLSGTLAGLLPVAGSLPQNVCGGTLSDNGGSTITLSGGTLAAGGNCSFTVTLDVPAGATPGTYTNNTSNVLADVATTAGTVSVMGRGATADLIVAGLSITKAFTNDPVLPGGVATLEFTIDNLSPTESASDIIFTDDLDADLSGLVVSGALPTEPCGPGSSLVGTNFLIFTGGSLAAGPGAGSSCTFSVDLLVPAGAEDGEYNNVTSSLSGLVGGSTVVSDPAFDSLEVNGNVLQLTKEFTNDPAQPGGTVTLRFTIDNLDPSNAIADLSFTDNLDAALSGLTATGLPSAACGGTASGTSTISFAGGTLPEGGQCSFDVSLAVPATVPLGTIATNTTSEITGTLSGVAVSGDSASDLLEINFLRLSKDFSSTDVAAGGTLSLAFTIENLGNNEATRLVFSDDLDAFVPGATASIASPMDVCGVGSTLQVGSTVELFGGSVLPLGSCTFSVDVTVPSTTAPGEYTNTTSPLTQEGLLVADAAVDVLTVLDANLPPSVQVPVILPEPSAEGEATAASAVFTDPDSSTWTCTVDYGEGAGPVSGTVAGNTCLGPSYVYADDSNGPFTVTVSVTDNQGESASNSVSHAVTNVDPTVITSTSTGAECGAVDTVLAANISVTFTDPGFGPTESWDSSTIDWGDGTVDLATVVIDTPGAVGTPTAGTASGSHVYVDAGIYDITVTVLDDDGGVDTVQLSALVSGAAISGTTLQIIGTPGADTVKVTADDDNLFVTASFLGGPSSPSIFPLVAVDDLLIGTCAENDSVTLTASVDTPSMVFGGKDDDSLLAAAGDAQLFGQEGDDYLQGGSTPTFQDGGPGQDTLVGGSAGDELRGGDADDLLFGGPGDDQLFGELGSDELYGEQDDDQADGGEGNDFVYGGNGIDDLQGGPGNDLVLGDNGNDVADGGPGNDRVEGGNGKDDLFGGPGDDELFGNNGKDDLDGGPGNDLCNGGNSPDTFVNCENVSNLVSQAGPAGN